jgi:hypothetical protein
MKAISTKFLGPTNTKGSRIKAFDGDGNSVTISKDYGLDTYDSHKKAALKLCNKMRWKGCSRLVGGGTKTGFAFVFCNGK